MSHSHINMALIVTFSIAVCFPAIAGTYYVNHGSSGTGTGWADPYGTVQDALDAIETAADTNATVYIGKSSAGQTYTVGFKTYTNSLTVRLLGGYDFVDGAHPRNGTSSITNSAASAALSLGIIDGSGANGDFSDTNNHFATFVLSDFILKTGANGLQTSVNGDANNKASFVISNSTISTESTTAHPIYVNSHGMMPDLTLDNCDVRVPSGSNRAAIWTPGTLNVTYKGLTEIRNGCVIVGGGDNTGGGFGNDHGAIVYCGNKLIMTDSVVTNTGAGWAVKVGRSQYCHTEHEVINSTLVSTGLGACLFSANFTPDGTPTTISNSTVSAGGEFGLYMYGGGGFTTEFECRDSSFRTTATNGSAWRVRGATYYDATIENCSFYGRNRAFYFGEGLNQGWQTSWIRTSNTIFSAGSEDGSTNSSEPVIELNAQQSLLHLYLNRCIVKNGTGGILNRAGRRALVVMTNSVITDVGPYGVQLDSYGNSNYADEKLVAVNSTFSGMSTNVIFGENNRSDGILSAELYYTAFVPGDSGAAVLFENKDSEQSLSISGSHNAFYTYHTYVNNSGGAGYSDAGLSNTDDSPSGDAGLDTDGYHLKNSSPFINTYILQAGDPEWDIDGDSRPQGQRMDIGADEFVPPRGTIVIIK